MTQHLHLIDGSMANVHYTRLGIHKGGRVGHYTSKVQHNAPGDQLLEKLTTTTTTKRDTHISFYYWFYGSVSFVPALSSSSGLGVRTLYEDRTLSGRTGGESYFGIFSGA